jgi:RHS repeat-associated protein
MGVLKTQYIYDPFGRTTTTGDTSTNSFQYTGRENDGTGLYFYRARYYAPDFGRFISTDPIGLRGGLNTYAYVDSNPLRWTDPLGLAKSGETVEVPGTNTTVRIDPPAPTHGDSQRHAHVCQKGCDEIVVNADGTGSHGTDPSKIKNKKVLKYLAGKGIKVVMKCVAPVVFVYDWYDGGIGHAANELVWPVSEIWVQ